MAINFPNSPTNNQIFLDTTSGNRYIYNADKGQWRYAANSILQYSSDSQVLFNKNGDINGASGLTYNSVSNTTYANTLVVARDTSVGGDLSVAGNLYVVGSTTSLEANNLVIGDSLIYLAANNYSGTDLLAIGFVANYGNTTGANVHTGLYRDATTKQYYLFQGYDIEPANNNMVPYSSNMVNATLNADIITGNLTLSGVNTHNWIDSAFNKANAAYANANAVSVGANTWANTVGTAGNNYTNYVALSVNTYTSILAANNAVGANNWANTVGVAGNNYASILAANNAVGANAWANTVGTAGNNYASILAANNAVGANNWANTVGSSANAYATATYATLSNVAQIYQTTNISFNTANAAYAAANNITPQVAPSYNTANAAYNQANAAYIEANANYTTTNIAFDTANAAFAVANNISPQVAPSYNTANNAYNTANAAFAKANVGGANVASTPPTSPTNGQLWWDIDTGRLFIYYNDGDSSQWVEATPTPEIDINYYNLTNLAFNTTNAAYRTVNAVYASANSNWVVTNTVYDVANAAFASANNVAPQVEPAFRTANNAFFNSNAAFRHANAAYDSANNVAPQVAPSYRNANAAFIHANAAFDRANAGGANVSVTAPSGPVQGQLWWDSNYGKLYIYYNDGDSSQWVECAPEAPGIDLSILIPTNQLANAAFDTANAAFYKANNSGANVGQTAPTIDNTPGKLWWNSDLGKMFIYYTDPANTSSWIEASPSASAIEGAIVTGYINPVFDKANNAYAAANASKVYVANSAPGTPTSGSLWWNKDFGRLLVYYTDSDSSQWVDTSPSYDASPIYNTANAAYDKANSVVSSALAYAIALGM